MNTFWRVLTASLALALAAKPQSGVGIEGVWDGKLNTGLAELRVRLTVEKSKDRLTAKLASIDQSSEFAASAIRVDGGAVHLEFSAVKGAFDGKLDPAGNAIEGTWTQGKAFPLTFHRALATAASAGSEVDIQVPAAPTPFPGGGKTHLVYELRVNLASANDSEFRRIDVIAGSPLASFSGHDLSRMMPSTRVKAGSLAVVYMWITLADGEAVPTSLKHTIVLQDRTLSGPEVRVATGPLPALGPPLHGEGWLAVNGPNNESVHRRAGIPIHGFTPIAQRFAIDWVKVGPNSSTFKGDRKNNESYFAYGAEVLAVADGVVTEIKDGIPQNVPGDSRAVPMNLETLGGNHILMDMGQGRFAFYAHLQPGSLRVKAGDHVTRGQVIGLVGNSGNSSEPHLHFHVCDRDSPLISEGMPYVLESFGLRGKNKQYEKRERELPLSGDLVRFD